MAANKSEKEKEKLFNEIINDISENGKSLFASLKNRLSSKTFYEFMDEDDLRIKRYARATELRAELMAEDMLKIADSVEDDIIKTEDGREIINNNVINRDRLRVDSRKWLMSKMFPKKYGDRLELENNHNFNPKDITGITFDK